MKYLSINALLFFVTILSSSIVNANDNKNKPYLKEIPFSFDYGVPLIKVTIQGAEYNFLFDTGMPTVLSENLSTLLQLDVRRTTKGMDVNGNTSEEKFVVLNEISVGGVSFNQIEALSTDLKKGFEIGCLKLDGVLGNNIIKDAIWKIDYQNKVITLTDNIENFDLPKTATIVKFKTQEKHGYYSPNVDIAINNKKRKGVKFDTGSNGGVNLPLAYFSDKLDSTKSVEYYGIKSAALYGKGQNKTYVDSKVNSLKIGDLNLQNQWVTFNQNHPLIGNKFLQNFKIIIDYSEHKIFLIKEKELANEPLTNFGFQLGVDNQKALVINLYKNSIAEKNGLQLGDEILSVNGINFPQLLSENPCSFFFNNPMKEMDSITMVLSRDGIETEMQLNKEIFIK